MVQKAARAEAAFSPPAIRVIPAAMALMPMAAKLISSTTHPTAVPAAQPVPTTTVRWFAPAEAAHQAVHRAMTTAMAM